MSEFTAQVAREVFSLRALLEVAAVRLVLADLTHSKITRFEQALDQMGNSLSETGGSSWLSADDDIRFHDLLFEQSGHRHFAAGVGTTAGPARVLLVVPARLATSRLRYRLAGRELESSPRADYRGVRSRNTALAERAIVLHLTAGERTTVKRLTGADGARADHSSLQLLATDGFGKRSHRPEPKSTIVRLWYVTRWSVREAGNDVPATRRWQDYRGIDGIRLEPGRDPVG